VRLEYDKSGFRNTHHGCDSSNSKSQANRMPGCDHASDQQWPVFQGISGSTQRKKACSPAESTPWNSDLKTSLQTLLQCLDQLFGASSLGASAAGASSFGASAGASSLGASAAGASSFGASAAGVSAGASSFGASAGVSAGASAEAGSGASVDGISAPPATPEPAAGAPLSPDPDVDSFAEHPSVIVMHASSTSMLRERTSFIFPAFQISSSYFCRDPVFA